MAKPKGGSGRGRSDLSKTPSQIVLQNHQFLLPTTATQAAHIFNFGQKRFFSAEMVADVFNPYRHQEFELSPLVPPIQTIVPHTPSALRHLARASDQNWLLFYSYGLCLADLYLMFGEQKNDEPSFCPCAPCNKYSGLWLYNEWARKSVEPGYYFLDTESRAHNLPYHEQNDAIAKLGRGELERAPTSLIAEAFFAAHLITGENLFRFFQWGEGYNTAKKMRVMVGNGEATPHKEKSLIIVGADPEKGRTDTGVYVRKLPEIKNIILA